MFSFITRRPLWVNILAGILLAVGAFFIFVASLGWLTNHNDSKTVPAITGMGMEKAIKTLDKAGFIVEIQDSVYVDSLPPMSVLKQIPDGDEIVKSSRIVYLVVNRAVPPLIDMPNLVGYSFRNAELTMKAFNLKLGDTTRRPDFALNSVLEQSFNGSPIAAGAKIRMGSTISLVLGDGIGNSEFIVPTLVGMTFGEAKELMSSKGLSFGVVTASGVADTANSFIYKQIPEKIDDEKQLRFIRSGQTIDIWLSRDKPSDSDTTNNN